MNLNPPNAIDREQLQQSHDDALRSLDHVPPQPPKTPMATDEERAEIHAWLVGGMFDFLREIEK